MLAEDELAELAEDIKQRGLLHPIVRTPDGQILDGRNRYAACELAGIEPRFTTYEGDDPAGYALAVNIARRHLTTGARAVLAEQARRLGGMSTRKAATGADLHHRRIMDAALVLDYAPHLVPAIVAGLKPLSVAVAEAREHKVIADAVRAKEDRVRKADPDLMSLVAEQRMDLDEALAVLDAREEKARREAESLASAEERERRQREQEHREAIGRYVNRLGNFLDGFSTATHLANDPNREDVLAALSHYDRDRFLRIEKETTWPSIQI
jgi:ParB-like chromosome segregation protein Spo0J